MELEFNMDCPSCKRVFKEKFKNVSPGKDTKCPSCGVRINFKGDNLSKIQKDIDKALKGFSKRIEIKL